MNATARNFPNIHQPHWYREMSQMVASGHGGMSTEFSKDTFVSNATFQTNPKSPFEFLSSYVIVR